MTVRSGSCYRARSGHALTTKPWRPLPADKANGFYSASMDHAEVVPDLAGPADLPSLVVTFAAAFSDDAMIRWPMPEATPAMLQELFRVILAPYVEFGVLWKIGGCDGGAAWLPPGVAGRFDEIEQSGRAAINPLTAAPATRRFGTGWALTCPVSPAGSWTRSRSRRQLKGEDLAGGW